MVVHPDSDKFRYLVRDAEAVALTILVRHDLVDKHATQEYHILRDFLVLVRINKQALVSKYIVPDPHGASPLTYLHQFTLLNNPTIPRHNTSLSLRFPICIRCHRNAGKVGGLGVSRY